MGVSIITAYIIATRNDIVIAAGGPGPDGKFMGWITLGEEDRFRPLLNSEANYDTAEAAEQAMRDTVDELRRAVAEETGGKHPIDHVMGDGPGASIVKQVIAGARDMRAVSAG